MTGIGLPDSFTSTTLVNGEASTLVEEESGCRAIAIGRTSYVEVPDAVGLPAGKRWIRWDDQESSEASFEAVKDPVATVRDDNMSEVTVSMVMIAYDGAGPAQYLAELRKDAAPQQVGEETIDGVTTTPSVRPSMTDGGCGASLRKAVGRRRTSTRTSPKATRPS